MARFIDLEVEEDAADGQDPSSSGYPPSASTRTGAASSTTPMTTSTPTASNAATRAFQCYPIVFGIVSNIDLTTLDTLSRTSRLIHHGLIQYRSALIASTLRCSNETVPIDPEETFRYRVGRVHPENVAYMDAARQGSDSYKAGSCARDMVGECRRCAQVICRNCAIKPPAATALRERHRRLCIACAKAPIATVASPPLDEHLPLKSDAMQRAICNCDSEGVWLCQPCGRSIRNTDNEYQRIWRWRNHYGEVLGCLGTGIGDADRGVICGRDDECIAAREREQETDCDAEDARGSLSRTPSDHHPTTPPAMHHQGSYFPAVASSSPPHSQTVDSLIDESRVHDRTPSPLLLGPGYERHEIEGIGGIVKRKLVRMVRVGACVPEWEEERSSSRVLSREVRGEARSWCGWCWRVVPGRQDLAVATKQEKGLPVREAQRQGNYSSAPRLCAPVSS